jgi:hypothetical protein
MFCRIVIGVDGREGGRDAIVLAAGDARMTTVHVADPAAAGSPLDARPGARGPARPGARSGGRRLTR